MRKLKRFVATVLAFSLILEYIPAANVSYAEETTTETTEASLNETLLLDDDFSSDTWNTTTADPVGYWRLGYNDTVSKNWAGALDTKNDRAPLGPLSSNRNLYFNKNDANSILSDVHMKATVCVTGENTSGTNYQYHLLIARATNAGQNGIAFGFRMEDGATQAKLVVCNYGSNDAINQLYFVAEAEYELNTEYELELYVVDSFVIAKCDGETIYAQDVTVAYPDVSISEKGHCGIIDRRAYNSTTKAKSGYFDNFSIATITIDGFEVNGPVVADTTGKAIADIKLTSGGVEVLYQEDAEIYVPDMVGKPVDLYQNCDITVANKTAQVKKVFLVADLSKIITSMNDDRWDSYKINTDPQFTVDEYGVATLNVHTSKDNALSMLDASGNGEKYTNFYVEYDLTMSSLVAEANNYFDQYFCMGDYGTAGSSSNSWDNTLYFDTRTSQAPNKTFWSRLKTCSGAAESVQKDYSTAFADPEIKDGIPVNIGMAVYDNTVSVYINGEKAATHTGESSYSGYFGLWHGKGGTATVKNFVYVPLQKELLELTPTEEVEVNLYGTLEEVTVIPTYNWPYGDGGEVQATITDFDNKRLGMQEVTATYAGVEQLITVNVYDDSVKYLYHDEEFESNPFTSTKWGVTDNVAVIDEVVVMDGAASAFTSGTYEHGYIQATVALTEVTGTECATTLTRKLDDSNSVNASLRVTKDDEGNLSAEIHTFVVNEGTTVSGDVVPLENFALGTNYKIGLCCIGNYIEVQVDGAVKAQYTLDAANSMNGVGAHFGFTNVDGATATLDNLTIIEYTPFQIAKEEDNYISLPKYSQIDNTSTENERSAFLKNESVILTINAPEGKQLSAAGGLRYYIDNVDVTYAIKDRVGEAGANQEISNQFVLTMPAASITLSDNYVSIGTDQANVGIVLIDLREKSDTKKSGLRFSSRAYKDYKDANGTTYELVEVGTILLKEQDEVTTELLQACYESETGVYQDESGILIGKKVKAKFAQDVCDEFIDWGLILTYDDASILADVDYTGCSYAVYEDATGKQVVQYARNRTTYNYNEVAYKVGLDSIVAPYLFYDVFSSAYKTDWNFATADNATYDIENGQLSIKRTDATNKSEVVANVNGGEEWTNYAVSADVIFNTKLSEEAEQQRASIVGLTARKDGSNYYEFRLQYNKGAWSGNLYRFGTGGTTALVNFKQEQLEACVGKALSLGTQYNLRFEVRGNLLRCYVNNTALPVYEDASEYAITAGTAGIKTVNSIVAYEDFIVEEKTAEPTVGLYLVDTEGNTVDTVALYEGFDIDLTSYKLKVLDDDGTYVLLPLIQEMISEFDNTELGEQDVMLTYGDFSCATKVYISERPEELATFAEAVTNVAAEAAEEMTETVKGAIVALKESYDAFSPYELSKLDATVLESYENMQNALAISKDANLENCELLLADAMNDVTEDTWNDSIMGNGVKWIPLNGALYQAQDPYGLAVTGWQSPSNVYGEIYSISSDMTLLSDDMYMGIALNMTASGHYMARVSNSGRDESDNVVYKAELLKLTNNGYQYLGSVDVSEYEITLEQGVPFNLRLTLKGGILNVYVNDVNVVSCDESAAYGQHLEGECGLRVYCGDGLYDNVRIYGKALTQEVATVSIEPTTFTDNFDDETVDSSPSHWVENSIATAVVDNWKIYEVDSTNTYGTIADAGYTETWLHVFEKDPEFTFDFIVQEAYRDAKIGFITRRSPDTTFVNIGYDFYEMKWYIESQESVAAGCETIWAEESYELNCEQWYTARVVEKGNTVEVYIKTETDTEEVMVIKVDNVSRTGYGKIGFFTVDAGLYVDNVNCSFANGDTPQDGVISYVMEPDKYSKYLDIESLDDGTLVGTGTVKKLSTDGGITWSDISADESWDGLGDKSYPNIIELRSGTYLQVLQSSNFEVQTSTDLKTWTKVGQMVPTEEITKDGEQLAILHLNSLTEVEMKDGTLRILCPVAFRKMNASGGISGHYTRVYYSDDAGETWTASETTTIDILPGCEEDDSTTWSESKIVQCTDEEGNRDVLRMYYSRNYLGCMQYTESTDYGVTWSGLYQVPEMQCAMSSFAIAEDPVNRGTYYMIWMNGEPNYLGCSTPRVRPCLLKSTDGKNWEFLMNCEYMTEYISVTNGVSLYQALDPSLYVTDGYVYITFGRSEVEYSATNANSHQAQRCYYMRVDKTKLARRDWDASTVANMAYAKTIEIETQPQTQYHVGDTFTLSDGTVKITAINTSTSIEDMRKNCYVYEEPDMTTAGTYTVKLYYVNGTYIGSYEITVSQ